VAARLFVFVQFEFPWPLGPEDGRYLLRAAPGAEPERVVVLGELSAERLPVGRVGRREGFVRRRLDRRRRPADRGSAPVTTSRATIIDPVPLSAEGQARAWLAGLDVELEALAAAGVLNRVLHAHRVAAADPYCREVSPGHALVIRAGWGEGEQVADGAWAFAQELPWRAPGRRGLRRDRSSALRPQERLAALLGGRGGMLLCEELTLRARLDLDQRRTADAALQLQAAYAAALAELEREGRQDLALRLTELRKLEPQVREQAALALAGEPADLDGEALEHALGRLEAALRARTASGLL
jgi:hypothetical protein